MNFNLPNFLTILRIICVPVIAIIIILPENQNKVVFAFYLFILAALTDYFDGLTARKLNQTTEFGKVLDPIADKLTIVLLLFVLYSTNIGNKFPIMLGIPMLTIIFREIFVSGLREYLGKKSVVLEVSWMAKIKTTMQLLAVGTLIGSLAYPLSTSFEYLGLLLTWIAGLLTLVSGLNYFIKAIPYFKE